MVGLCLHCLSSWDWCHEKGRQSNHQSISQTIHRWCQSDCFQKADQGCLWQEFLLCKSKFLILWHQHQFCSMIQREIGSIALVLRLLGPPLSFSLQHVVLHSGEDRQLFHPRPRWFLPTCSHPRISDRFPCKHCSRHRGSAEASSLPHLVRPGLEPNSHLVPWTTFHLLPRCRWNLPRHLPSFSGVNYFFQGRTLLADVHSLRRLRRYWG